MAENDAQKCKLLSIKIEVAQMFESDSYKVIVNILSLTQTKEKEPLSFSFDFDFKKANYFRFIRFDLSLFFVNWVIIA